MKHPLFSKVRAFFFVSAFTPLTIFCALGMITSAFFDKGGPFQHRFARIWSRISLLLAGARLEISGTEHISAGPTIFMSNHQGNFDIIALLNAIPIPVAWMAKKELFDIPIFGHSLKHAGYIPLDRGNGRNSLRSIVEAAETIKNGRSVIIFPEGTRSPDGNLLPFKKGGFILAAKAGVPIVPTIIEGSVAIQPPRIFSISPGTIRIRFLPTVSTTGKNPGELMGEVQRIIATGLGQ